jgi:hypothetical protein
MRALATPTLEDEDESYNVLRNEKLGFNSKSNLLVIWGGGGCLRDLQQSSSSSQSPLFHCALFAEAYQRAFRLPLSRTNWAAALMPDALPGQKSWLNPPSGPLHLSHPSSTFGSPDSGASRAYLGRHDPKSGGG